MEAGISGILGSNKKTVPQEMIDLVLEEIKVRETILVVGSVGVARPPLGVVEYKIGQCSVQFFDASDYNEHMRDIHGVITSLQDLVQSNLYPNPSAPAYNPNDGSQNNQAMGVLGMGGPYWVCW